MPAGAVRGGAGAPGDAPVQRDSARAWRRGFYPHGVHARNSMLVDEENRAFVQAMQRLKAQLLAVMVVVLLGALLALVCAVGWARTRGGGGRAMSAPIRSNEGGGRSLPERPPRSRRVPE